MQEEHWCSFYRKNDEKLSYCYKNTILTTQTKYQSVNIIETTTFGTALILDDSMQSTEIDEFCYHEGIVHPAMCFHKNPKKIFIAGGGEGATLKEALKHNIVQKAFMVDLDEELVEICKKYLPQWHQGAFEDPRSVLIYDDARKALKNTQENFDVIITDITAPKHNSPAVKLYTKEFYSLVKDKLTEDGIFITQAQSTNCNNLSFLASAINTLKHVFPYVTLYSTNLASDGDEWGFLMASKIEYNPELLDVDKILNIRGVIDLKLYDSETHKKFFSLPKYVRKVISEGKGYISTDAKPFSYEEINLEALNEF